MDKVLQVIQQVLAALNDPLTKTVLLFCLGFLYKRLPGFQAKAIPFLNLAASILLGAAQIASALGGIVTPTKPALYMAAAAHPGWNAVLDALFGTVLPVIAATGAHSSWKNTAEWLEQGYMIFKKK